MSFEKINELEELVEHLQCKITKMRQEMDQLMYDLYESKSFVYDDYDDYDYVDNPEYDDEEDTQPQVEDSGSDSGSVLSWES